MAGMMSVVWSLGDSKDIQDPSDMDSMQLTGSQRRPIVHVAASRALHSKRDLEVASAVRASKSTLLE